LHAAFAVLIRKRVGCAPGLEQMRPFDVPDAERNTEKRMRLRKLTLPAAIMCATVAAGVATHGAPPARPGPTVNDYTAAESGRAEAAARNAGYDKFEITMVQDGNFFLKGEKAGQTYFLTVTPDGKVYPSTPSSPASG
jgi:hypothetical protein